MTTFFYICYLKSTENFIFLINKQINKLIYKNKLEFGYEGFKKRFSTND